MGSAIYLIIWLVLFLLGWHSIVWSCTNDPKKTGRNVSPAAIPLAGPVFGIIGIMKGGYSLWLIPVILVTDPFLFLLVPALPHMLSEAWRFSRFTRIATYLTSDGNRRTALSLHEGGHYLLVFEWSLERRLTGATSLSDFGRFVEVGENLVLTSHTGAVIHIAKKPEGYLEVLLDDHKEPTPGQPDAARNLTGCRLRRA